MADPKDLAPANQTTGEKTKYDGRANLKPWQPGQSGNPGGRPKGVPARIRAITNDGDDILALYADVMRGRLPDGEPVRARDRLEAANQLALRLWGKPVETTLTIAADAKDAPGAVAALDSGTLEALARALLPSATVTVRQRAPARDPDAEVAPLDAKPR